MKQLIESINKTHKCAKEFQKQVDAKKVLDPDTSSSELSTVLHSNHSCVENVCLHKPIKLLNASLTHLSKNNLVPDLKYLIPG